jgi:phage terminase small subunit
VVKTKGGFPILNPYLQVANTAMKQMKGFLVQFGMTPGSRSRIKVSTHDDAVDEDDAFFRRPA